MRQTETDGFHPSGAGRSSERPVSISDQRRYRGMAGDGAECLAALNRRTILLARPVAGIACRLRLSPSQYQGVALIRRGGVSTVRLLHRDPALTVDLMTTADHEAAASDRERIAALLSLPMVGPALRLVVDQPQPRRGSPAGRRRPRFLHKRRPGATEIGERIEGEEIIAPE